MDKFDRNEWGQVWREKDRLVVSDFDGHWSDFEKEEDDVDRIEYLGVHPDNDQIDEFNLEMEDEEIDDFEL